MADLLIELGCEELPAGSVMPMATYLGNALHDVLSASELCSTAPQIFATPRRLAARFTHVGDRQADATVERRGPAMAAAYKEGEPTKALLGFLRGAGASIDDVQSVATPKGEWVVVQQTQAGRTLAEVLEKALPEIVKNMPMPKRMRWGAHSHEFLRPVVWLLALHGSETVPLAALGLKASNTTRGHRFHSSGELTLASPSDYESTLEQAHVIADPEKRRSLIVNDIQAQADRIGGKAVMDTELVDEVSALVEWPVALAGNFDEEFLAIPKEALIQTMQENQRYFALLDKQGELLPAFIFIANLDSSNVATVVEGNERVIRPRFADTMFFWNQDKKVSLASHQKQLGRLVFQEKLGTVADKVERMGKTGQWLASELSVDAEEITTAVSLCKCDLNTEIVKELAKMQGICGRYYAERDGHTASVAQAMEQHYFPKQAGGVLPEGGVSQVVALADKTDTLVGIYGLGMVPTGAKDPFGLRRASLGIARIIIECQLDLDLTELLQTSRDSYGDRLVDPDMGAMLAYVMERLRGYLLDRGYAADAIDAVLAKKLTRPLDIVMRLEAIEMFRRTEAATSLAAASKRITNILKKVDGTVPDSVDADLFKEPAERSLYEELEAVQPGIEAAMQERDYTKAMQDTARLKQSVDSFFDDVMVMDEDPVLRGNRLALLQRVNKLCCGTAELGLLRPGESNGTTGRRLIATKLIVLDRDGVINEDLERPVASLDEWVPIEGSLEAIARLYQGGWSVAVATNQSGISRGLLELSTLHDIHRRMHEMVHQMGGKIDVVAFCPHTESDDCACRKPAPGMLYSISERLGVDLTKVITVGDSLRDMQAAMAAAATPVIVRTGKGQKTLDTHKGTEHIPAFDNLASYVDDLLAPKQKDE